MARAPGRLTPPTGYRELVAEGVLLAGGARALLLQVAHPAIARGVAEHSGFAADPTRRLLGTLTYLYTLAFGTEEEVARATRDVARAHRGVASAAEPDPYSARDPRLQLWVTATLYDTTVQVAELTWGPLEDAVADQVYRESARIGTALGMPAEEWPADRAAFAVYWADAVAGLHVGPTARRLAVQLLRPTAVPGWLRAGMPLARLFTAGLLPDAVRSAYRVRWEERTARRFDRTLAVLLTVYRALPRSVRTLPSRVILRRFRAAVPAAPPTPPGA